MLAAPLAYAPADGVFSATWLLIALPMAATVVLLLGGRRTDRWGHLLACLMSAASFVFALVLFFNQHGRAGDDRSMVNHLWTWIPVAGFHVDAALLLDQLSMVFVLLITGVGTAILIYSIGYMAHDPRRRRFFAYMSLFLSSMLTLVLMDNYLGLYVGWEGVGLASYLLIGFWTERPSAATAAKKAFIANRVGDVGLSLAIMLMFATFGRVDFASVFGAAGAASHGAVTGICLLLLLGACGKSGQFPLQTWLPDAMEGPTPVSALIHAATMVTAGVYLITRSGALFDHSGSAQAVVLAVGAVTLLYGCICGCAYDDIKKVLAYSTVSQIGYMFLAAGLGTAGYAIAILHLLTHGFFKATLFLGAGSVMHGMNDQVDMRRFGGLARVMPVTFATFGIGYLAIIGFPGLSGFFSKDKIIEAAFDKGGAAGWTLGIVGLLGAGLTAFYMTRLMAMTFLGERRWTPDVHPHESPKIMTGPLILLAVGSAIVGGLLVIGGALQNWLAPAVGHSVEVGTHTINPTVVIVLSVLVMLLGAAGGYIGFATRPVPEVPPAATPVTVAARQALYADAFNEAVLMRPGLWSTRALVFVDNRGVDGIVNGIAAFLGGSSARLRRVQTGFVRSYALSMFGGAAVVVGALLLARLA